MRGKYEAKILNGGVEEGTNEENSRGFLPKDAARMTAEEEKTEGGGLYRAVAAVCSLQRRPSLHRGSKTKFAFIIYRRSTKHKRRCM